MPPNEALLEAVQEQPGAAAVRIADAGGGRLVAALTGAWKLDHPLPAFEDLQRQLDAFSGIRRIEIDASDLEVWDSGLLTFLINLSNHCSGRNIDFDREGLPRGVRNLLRLASEVPERQDARRKPERAELFERIGAGTLQAAQGGVEVLTFIGEAFAALLKFFVGRAQFQRSDLLLFIQECGANALPIVTLISLLVGLIFAFVGAVQLVMFGAQIYVANLVAIAMVRVVGALMAAVIMAGRTGAAFAAQLGTMQVNEEIDALKTLGISPMEFLVLPRMLALIIMMPLLCVYADLMGIIGGLIVGVGMLDVGLIQYLNQTKMSLNLTHFWIGITHSIVFGMLIALAGCLRGMQCGRSASAVGDATTSAVVTSIVALTIATAVITFVCNVLRI
jgi:phospholipid/cholesterol/gamma-HCH transport system permease protein